jgi:hypothetical protein
MLRNYRWYLQNRACLSGDAGDTRRLLLKQHAPKLAKIFF